MDKFNSSTVSGDLNVSSTIAENGVLIDDKYGIIIEYVKPTISAIDATIYTEPDGSKWAHVFHHNNPNGSVFPSDANFTSTVNTDTNRWFDIAKVANQINVMWEIILVQTRTSGGTKEVYRFKQYYNPMTATFAQTTAANVTKYTSSTTTYFKGSSAAAINDMSSSYGGIHLLNSSNTYLVQNNSSNGNWYGATGCKVKYTESSTTGIPGYNGGVCSTGCMDMYIRIDSLFTNIILKNSKGDQLGDPISLR